VIVTSRVVMMDFDGSVGCGMIVLHLTVRMLSAKFKQSFLWSHGTRAVVTWTCAPHCHFPPIIRKGGEIKPCCKCAWRYRDAFQGGDSDMA